MSLPEVNFEHYRRYHDLYGKRVERLPVKPGDRVIFFDLDDTLGTGDVLKMALEKVVEKLTPELAAKHQDLGDRLLKSIIAYQNRISNPHQIEPVDFYRGKQLSRPGDSSTLGTLLLQAAEIQPEELLDIADLLHVIDGMPENIADFRADGFKMGILSSAFQPVVEAFAQRLGISWEMAIGTHVNQLTQGNASSSEWSREAVIELITTLAGIEKYGDGSLKSLLADKFENFLKQLQLDTVKSVTAAQAFSGMGGEYKAYVLKRVAERVGAENLAFVGDGRTDIVGMWLLSSMGGLSIALHALPLVAEQARVVIPHGESRRLLSRVVQNAFNGVSETMMSGDEEVDPQEVA